MKFSVRHRPIFIVAGFITLPFLLLPPFENAPNQYIFSGPVGHVDTGRLLAVVGVIAICASLACLLVDWINEADFPLEYTDGRKPARQEPVLEPRE